MLCNLSFERFYWTPASLKITYKILKYQGVWWQWMHFSSVKDVATNVNNFSFAFLLILKNLEEKIAKPPRLQNADLNSRCQVWIQSLEVKIKGTVGNFHSWQCHLFSKACLMLWMTDLVVSVLQRLSTAFALIRLLHFTLAIRTAL